MIRLIVCIDLDTDDLLTAYRQVRNILGCGPAPKPPVSWDWETSDEWYRFEPGLSDADADAEDPRELSMVIGESLMFDEKNEPDPWDNDLVQFARLIVEINANVAILPEDGLALLDSMDFDLEDLTELMDRADAVWEKAKAPPEDPLTTTRIGLRVAGDKSSCKFCRGEGPACLAPAESGMHCSRDAHHEGPHVACGALADSHAVERWYDKEET